MWYALGIATAFYSKGSHFANPIEISSGVRLEPIPDWAKTDDALKLLSWADRKEIHEASLAFVVEYEAGALGSPDPAWTGTRPRSIQSAVDEKIALAGAALWLSKPSQLSPKQLLHFSRKGDSTSLRQSSTLRPVLVSESEEALDLAVEDLRRAGVILGLILSLPRTGTTWIAIRMLVRALSESLWEARYLLQWIVLESLFGPDVPSETTYRLAQRIGSFLGDGPETKRRIYEEAKQAYAWRSKIVHGRRLSKLSSEQSLELSHSTEAMIRKSLSKVLLVPGLHSEFDGAKRDEYLNSMIFR